MSSKSSDEHISGNGSESENEMEDKNPTGKAENYISWDDYFMAAAVLASMRSKDPVTKVGACIVNDEKKIIGIGYNGFPKGCSDDVFSWKKKKRTLDNKHLYVCHAEVNALLNRNCCNTNGCKMYVTLFPCNECTKFIIQSGIKEIIYLNEKSSNKAKCVASYKMLEATNIKYRKFECTKSKLEINLTEQSTSEPALKKSRQES